MKIKRMSKRELAAPKKNYIEASTYRDMKLVLRNYETPVIVSKYL